MCLIIDVNSVHQIFPNPTSRMIRLNKDILIGKAILVYGGKLLREYLKMDRFLKLLKELDRRGSARRVSDTPVDIETERLRNSNACRSDDPHIIALARVSHVRLLITSDRNLQFDFKNDHLVKKPRGKVYTSSEHTRLIKLHCCA
jgi:hypothetical protein